MRRRIIWIAPTAALAMVLFTFIGGEIVMHLWNWLLPGLFGWRLITFWQALGLLVLCRILFGRLGVRGPRGPSLRWRMRQRWERMTPEEREKFRERMRSRCGGFSEPASGAKEST